MTEWIFGIDGGGTSSRIRIERIDGSLLYRAEGGGCNPQASSMEAASSLIIDLLTKARVDAKLHLEACRAGFIGCAGVDRGDERAAMTRLVSIAIGPPTILSSGSDAEAALAGAMGSPEGYILIAGTGSIALARSGDGHSCRAGGWGHWLGDEGSAFWLAFEAIKRGIRGHEGRAEATSLYQASLDFFALRDATDIKRMVYSDFDKAAIARFAVIVEEERKAGDTIACMLFTEAAHELASLVVSVYERFGTRLHTSKVAMYGGLLDNNKELLTLTSNRLQLCCPKLSVAPRFASAEEGACILARANIA